MKSKRLLLLLRLVLVEDDVLELPPKLDLRVS